jgi:hypothetical protein
LIDRLIRDPGLSFQYAHTTLPITFKLLLICQKNNKHKEEKYLKKKCLQKKLLLPVLLEVQFRKLARISSIEFRHWGIFFLKKNL